MPERSSRALNKSGLVNATWGKKKKKRALMVNAQQEMIPSL